MAKGNPHRAAAEGVRYRPGGRKVTTKGEFFFRACVRLDKRQSPYLSQSDALAEETGCETGDTGRA